MRELGGANQLTPPNWRYGQTDDKNAILAVAKVASQLWVTWNDAYAAAGAVLRTANDNITHETPLKRMLTPTTVPMAQAELDGH